MTPKENERAASKAYLEAKAAKKQAEAAFREAVDNMRAAALDMYAARLGLARAKPLTPTMWAVLTVASVSNPMYLAHDGDEASARAWRQLIRLGFCELDSHGRVAITELGKSKLKEKP